jgi:uncharacterized protein YgiM (DUF1202 family)
MKKKARLFLGGFFILIIGILLLSVAGYSQDNEFPFKGKITSNNVKLRAGYNENFTALKNLKKDEELIVVDRYFCWYQVKLPNDVYCYISKAYVNDQGLVTANSLNIRAGAGEKYHILGKLKKGEPVFIVGTEGDWYKIVPPEGASGWVSEDYLEKIAPIQVADIPKAQPAVNQAFKSREIIDYDRLPKIESQNLQNYTTEEINTYILAYNTFLGRYPNSKYTDEIKYKVNLLNIKLNNKQDEIITTLDAKIRPEEVIEVSGTLRDLGRIYGTQATHKLKIKGRSKYYLESTNIDLDKYVYKKVKITGVIKDESSKYPLIEVNQIEVEE